MAITEHAEKYSAFKSTLASFYPHLELLKPIEDHDVDKEAYRKCRKLFEERSDLAGIYVTTEASIPVLRAASDAKALERLTIITTDLFPDLEPYIRSGAVAASIYQRPRAQGQIALRLLHEFLSEGGRRSHQLSLAPHLVMRGNLDFFLNRQSQESAGKIGQNGQEAHRLVANFA
jgi:ABC-type sugar transport system substrate-binding protein